MIRPRDKGDVPDDPLSRMRHSASHVMADAVQRLRPDAKVAIGPSIETGFYYDFDTEPFAPEDAERIEAEMRKIIAENLPLRAAGGHARRGAASCSASRGEKYKVEIIESIPEGERGLVLPARRLHRPVPRAARRADRRHQGVQGAVVRGRLLARRRAQPRSCSASTAPRSRRRRSSTRTWPRIEEAKRRDHRDARQAARPVLVRRPGRPGLRRSGTPRARSSATRSRTSSGARTCAAATSLVYTPHVAREQLLETSGHLAHYKENLFGGMELDGQRYLVKPMNCPFHIAIYRSQMRSYRDLPLRYSELGTVYRYERSGVLHGLLRVRGFTQDDGHLFVREDQIDDEMARLRARSRSTCSSCSASRTSSCSWRRARRASWASRQSGTAPRRPCAGCSRRPGRPFEVDEGGGAFYGPKIDLKIKDALGRRVAVLDLPARLPAARALRPRVRRPGRHAPAAGHDPPRAARLDRALHRRAHRALRGRVPAVAGAGAGAGAVGQREGRGVRQRGRRAAARPRGCGSRPTSSADKLGAKIRRAQMEKIPYMVVVGEKDMAARVVSPRTREGQQQPADAARRVRAAAGRGSEQSCRWIAEARRHYNEVER